jgi:hypothetical protein
MSKTLNQKNTSFDEFKKQTLDKLSNGVENGEVDIDISFA